MNRLQGKIAGANTGDGTTLLRIGVKHVNLYVLILEHSVGPYFKIEHVVEVFFKETSVFLFKNMLLKPHQNCFDGNIVDIQEGELLDRYALHTPLGNLFSVFPRSITCFACGDSVTIYLPPHDMTLWEWTGSPCG
jgi:hypothetical protein